MKKWFTLAVAVAVVGFTGCSSNSEKKTEVSTEKGKFDLMAPGDVTVTQGKDEKFKVSINRKGYEDAVDLDFSDLPKGTSVEGDKKIDKGSDSVELKLHADKDAKEVENSVVSIKGSGGKASGTVKFKVTIKKSK